MTEAELRPIRLLVCDDQPAVVRGLARLLDDFEDLEVAGVALGGREAELMAKELAPDIAILEIYMRQNGLVAARAITSRSDTRVLVLSVSDRESDLNRALQHGASGYVTKDQDLPGIVAAIRAVHEGLTVFPSRMATSVAGALESEHPAGLTSEEQSILQLISEGHTNAEIAMELHLSDRTVRRRIHDVYHKMKLTDSRRASAYAAQVSMLFAGQSSEWSDEAKRRSLGAQIRRQMDLAAEDSPTEPN